MLDSWGHLIWLGDSSNETDETIIQFLKIPQTFLSGLAVTHLLFHFSSFQAKHSLKLVKMVVFLPNKALFLFRRMRMDTRQLSQQWLAPFNHQYI